MLLFLETILFKHFLTLEIVSSNPSEITINVATSELPKEVFKERAYEEKKLQKARDELLKSEAKKRADEEAKSRKDVEMKYL